MTHKLKTKLFSQKIEHSGGVFFWPLTPLFSFVTFHLNQKFPHMVFIDKLQYILNIYGMNVIFPMFIEV